MRGREQKRKRYRQRETGRKRRREGSIKRERERGEKGKFPLDVSPRFVIADKNRLPIPMPHLKSKDILTNRVSHEFYGWRTFA